MAAGDYPGSTFYGADPYNYGPSNRESSYNIDKVVIHIVQGPWSSAINSFLYEKRQVSAHYTVRSSDGFVGQSVREKDIAYHAGNYPVNTTSIGIEHEGFFDEPKWYTDAMIRSSARLTAYLCNKYAIPVDRAHVIGHGEASSTPCPGTIWDWARYMNLVRGYAAPSPAPTPYEFVVDNATSGRFAAAAGVWKTSSYSSAKYGRNYRYASPGRTTSHAKFKVAVPTKGAYTVYGRWPASSGYNSRAVFRILTASGWVSKPVSQRQNGGRWVPLGTYTLNAGDSYAVQLSNRTTGKGYIVADAVKIVRV